MKNFLKYIFSVKNREYAKEITILGLKIKLSNKRKEILYLIDKLHEHNIALINKFHEYNTTPIVVARNDALKESMEYLYNHMKPSKILFSYDRIQNLKESLRKVEINGLYIECGVFNGESINIIANCKKDKTIYGFDCFEGLPADWGGYNLSKNTFDLGGKLPDTLSNVELIKGYFSDTLPKFSKEHEENIAFLHVDCDIYPSAVDIFNAFGRKIVSGTIILFDEYFNYPNWKNGEFKAWQEFCRQEGIAYEYITVGYQQVGVKVLKKGALCQIF